MCSTAYNKQLRRWPGRLLSLTYVGSVSHAGRNLMGPAKNSRQTGLIGNKREDYNKIKMYIVESRKADGST